MRASSVWWRAVALLLAIGVTQVPADAQTRRRTPARRPARAAAPAPPVPKTEPAMVSCPDVLGEGMRTRRVFCDVPIGRDPASGIVITLPPHKGDVTLRFDLHNRHTYSEELTKSNRGFRRYTASIGVLTADNTLLSRAVVLSEFRTADDLVDRIAGGAGPGGMKAVAPTGTEAVVITIPEEEHTVTILGEKLQEVRLDGVDNFTAIGRPIAVVSNLMIEYVPGPAPRAPRSR